MAEKKALDISAVKESPMPSVNSGEYLRQFVGIASIRNAYKERQGVVIDARVDQAMTGFNDEVERAQAQLAASDQPLSDHEREATVRKLDELLGAVLRVYDESGVRLTDVLFYYPDHLSRFVGIASVHNAYKERQGVVIDARVDQAMTDFNEEVERAQARLAASDQPLSDHEREATVRKLDELLEAVLRVYDESGVRLTDVLFPW